MKLLLVMMLGSLPLRGQRGERWARSPQGVRPSMLPQQLRCIVLLGTLCRDRPSKDKDPGHKV